MTVVSSHVARDLALTLGHVCAASHQVGDLFAGLLPFTEICRLGTFDEDGEVIADSQRMDDVVGDEDDGDAPLACLQNDTQNVSRLFDPKRGGRLVKDQHAGSKMDGASNCQRLALASRQTADKTISIVDTSYPEVAHRLDGNFIGPLPVQAFERPPALLRLFADEERASDTHQRKRPAKLVDGRNAMV